MLGDFKLDTTIWGKRYLSEVVGEIKMRVSFEQQTRLASENDDGNIVASLIF